MPARHRLLPGGPPLNDQFRQWPETHSASACNHRRDTLTNLAKVLYRRRAAADFVDLVPFAPLPPPRCLERTHIAEVLAPLIDPIPIAHPTRAFRFCMQRRNAGRA